MNKFKQVVITREELLKRTNKFAKLMANIVGSTMTENGVYGSLLDEVTTNDGATVVSTLDAQGFGDDDIEKMYLSKLMEATEKTDELAGDGTSATTIITSALIDFIASNHSSSMQDVLKDIDEAEKQMLAKLHENKKNLVTQEDYENLAIVSTKNRELGKMIGKAIYDAGENSLLSIRKAINKSEDYVEVQSNYILRTNMCDSGLYEYLENSHIVMLDSILTDQDNALRQLDHWARVNNERLTIISRDIDETAVNFVKSSNLENRARGAVTLLTMPEMNRGVTQREIMEDLAAYCDTEVLTKEGFNTDSAKADSIKMGRATVNMDKEEGTIFTIEGRSELLEKRIEELTKKLSEYNKDTQIREISYTKMRINALNGTSVVIYVYERNESALQTKVMQIQDAVKATQYSMGFGYIGGAGYFFRLIDEDNAANKIAKYVSESYMNNLRKVMGREHQIEIPTKPTEMMIIDHDGKVTYGDVYEKGIIDSARVIENVIKNSFSIGREYARMGWKIIKVENE